MAERPLIVLVDGNALVHRAYHAIPPLTSPGGEPTNATFGFTSILLKVLEYLETQYAAVAWDVGRTFRHEQYADYKATRPPMSDDLREQFERIRQVVDTLNLPGKYVEGVVLSDNLEALFRNVPPPLSLALAMTEKHEKAERAAIMQEQNCSELEAVHIIAERIAESRRG